MKFEIGDIVLLLHSNEEAEVVDIINDKMVLVDAGGVQFPVYKDQIDFPYLKRFMEKKNGNEKKQKQYVDDLKKEKDNNAGREEDGMWLTFLPVVDTDEFGDDVVDELKVHLLNRTNTAYNFDYKLAFFGKPEFELLPRGHQHRLGIIWSQYLYRKRPQLHGQSHRRRKRRENAQLLRLHGLQRPDFDPDLLGRYGRFFPLGPLWYAAIAT